MSGPALPLQATRDQGVARGSGDPPHLIRVRFLNMIDNKDVHCCFLCLEFQSQMRLNNGLEVLVRSHGGTTRK